MAVLSVIGFHAFPEFLPGGFLGVDIFFVISGFLISSIIFHSLVARQFSILNFIRRRIIRIFPALILVLCTCLAFGSSVLTPPEFQQLAKHATGGASFSSNVISWRESGYFDASADTKPLLHLWSLAIEEQFYLLWPPVLMIAYWLRTKILALITILVIVSFALNIETINRDQAAAFYFPQTRIWELLLGALLAFVTVSRFHRSDKRATEITYPNNKGTTIVDPINIRHLLSFAGLMLISASLLSLSGTHEYPGWWAILPTLGAIIIISAGNQAWVNRNILSKALLVQFGLISYSLYLWHWPVLAFVRIIWGATPPIETRVSAVASSVLLAGITYIAIERPMRKGGREILKSSALMVCILLIGLVSYFGYRDSELPFKLTDTPVERIDGDIGADPFYEYVLRNSHPCYPAWIHVTSIQWNGVNRCRQSGTSNSNRIALVGDSHAEHLFIGIAEGLPQRNVVYYTGSGPPYADKEYYKPIFDYINGTDSISTVILAAAWAADADVGRLSRTLALLTAAGKKVYIVDDVPSFSFDAAACKFSRWSGQVSQCAEERVLFDRQSAAYRQILELATKNDPRIGVLNPSQYICDSTLCRMTREGSVLYRDSGHLNIVGSRFVGRQLIADSPHLGY